MVKVSVIVPVFNPGAHMDRLIASLLGQSLPARECELVFVDDGSTDGSGERLDALAAAHEHVRVRHIPNSGWPGRPRNVGLEMATGEFVFFADNDDWLTPEALERLHATAVTDDADIVIGKVVGHGKFVPRALFRSNRHDLTADDVPFDLLSPHKLFRRSLLDEHGLRFPERKRPLEDHALVVPAFFGARRISVLADHPCYHWERRDDGGNASAQGPDMEAYFASVSDVLDVVDAHTDPGERRDRLYLRWYRGKLLGRVGSGFFARSEPERRREMFEAARALAEARFDPALDAMLPYAFRLRAALLRRGSLEGLEALGEYDRSIRASARLRRVDGDGTWLTFRVNATLWRTDDREPPAVVREGDRLRFDAPGELRQLLGDDELDVKLADDRSTIVLTSLEDETEWELPTTVRIRVPEDDGPVRPQVRMLARVAPTVAAAGGPLPPGRYRARAVVAIAGFRHLVDVKREGEPFIVTVTPSRRLEHWGRRTPRPAPPPPPPAPAGVRARRAVARMPGLLPAVRRARRARRALLAR